MALINISNLTFAYNGTQDNIFENISFQIDTSWRLGFTGRNGRGKTTLLNLLLNKYEYTGTITKSVQLEYFPYTIEDKEANTIEVVQRISPNIQQWQILRELSLLNVDDNIMYRLFNTLSNGEQTKVLLASLFLKDNSFLLLDEPTNHLDFDARKTVSNYLSKKSGFILVSHDRTFLDDCVDHILSFNKTKIEVQKGNFSSWQYNKQLADNKEIEENERLKKDVKRLQLAAKQREGWSDKIEKTKYATKNSGLRPDRGYIGHKAAKMMKSAKVLKKRQENAINEKKNLLKNLEIAQTLKLTPLSHNADVLIRLENICISYGNRIICKKIDLYVGKGSRIAIYGKNGCGKSSILKLLLGESIEYTGNIYKASSLKISYVPQTTDHLRGKLKELSDTMCIDETLFKAILQKLAFERVQFEKNIEEYSEGQKKKVLIAASLCEKAHLYIWDEPLNYIDVLSRIQIENLIKQYNPTLIFVEHDEAFLQNIATQIINI